MNITIIFFLSLLIALIGVVPPGLLNMTAAKISLKEGYASSIAFSIGVCVTVCFQTYAAAEFARYLNKHPDVVNILQRVAFVIFVLITIYFLSIAKRSNTIQNTPKRIKSKKSRFFQGVLLSALNVFPIPYQAYMALTLASFGVLNFSKIAISSYVAGAAMGTFVMLYMYIFFFDKIRSKAFLTQKNMNLSIGTITGLVAIITLINIIKEI